MRWNTLVYTIKQGFKNIWRNKMFSLASIATMSACIFLFGLFFAIVTNFQHFVKEAQAGVAVTVFFEEGISDQQIAEMEQDIRKRVEVSKVIYVSAEDAWAKFGQTYFEGAEDLIEGFEDALAESDNFEVYLNDVSMQSALVTYLESMDGVQKVKKSEVVANTLTDFNRLLGYVSVAIILILLAVAIFLISNTVTVGISVRREEIAIMKLIGATDFFVRAPFIVEGILIGLIGSSIPLAILYYLYNKIIIYIGTTFNFLSSVMDFIPVNEVFTTLLPVGLIMGIGIGFLGSRLTLRKHLKV